MIPYQPIYARDAELRQELQRIAAVLSALSSGTLQVLYAEPAKPIPYQVVVADGVQWNPLGDGVQQPVWYDGSAWQALGGGPDPLSYFRQV